MAQSSPALLHEGDTVARTIGHVTIRIHNIGSGYRVTTSYSGPAGIGAEIDQLSKSYPTIAAAHAGADGLTAAFERGLTVDQVIAAVEQAARDIAAATPAQSPLQQLATLGTRRQIAPTHAGAQLNPTSIPGWIALAIADRNGRVERGGKPGQVQVKVLTALARKGYLVLTAKPGTRATNWAYGEITPTGRIELERIRSQRATADALHDALAKLGVAA